MHHHEPCDQSFTPAATLWIGNPIDKPCKAGLRSCIIDGLALGIMK